MVNEQNADLLLKRWISLIMREFPLITIVVGFGAFEILLMSTSQLLQKTVGLFIVMLLIMLIIRQFMLTAIYTPTRSANKDVFWHQLKQLNELVALP